MPISIPPSGEIMVDQEHYNPVVAYYDADTNTIINVTPDTPLPVSASITLESETLKIIEEVEVTVETAGTPVALPSNTSAKAVIVYNNNTNGVKVCVGLQATVDATVDPIVGIPLALAYSNSGQINVNANSNEIYVDASENGTKVTCHILG